jgi:hypothetical protein
MGGKMNVYRLLVTNPERRRPLVRPRRRWAHNIKIDLVEIGLGELDWIGVAQDRYRWSAVANGVISLQAP